MNMDIAELKKDPLIIEWFSLTEVEANTQNSFLYGMHYYTDFLNKNPAELVEEAEAEIEDGLLMRKRKIKQYLLTFREHLKSLNYAPKTIHSHMVAVKSFYKCFDVDLPQLTNRKQFRAIATEENGVRLEKQQIQEILKFADVRGKAIVLTAASSGLSQADLLDLTVGGFKNGFDESSLITTVSLRRKKTKTDFVTFLSPEASIAIKDYLDWRDRKPNDTSSADHPRHFDTYDVKRFMQTWEKRRVRKDSDFLFIKNYVPDSYLKSFDERERKLNSHGLMEMFRELAKKSGLDTEVGRWQIVRAHNLRKYFNSTLLNNGCEFFLTEFWMGHRLPGSQESYYRADLKALKEKYMKFVPFLSLTSVKTHVIESEEYLKLKNDYDLLKTDHESLKSDIQSMKEAFGMIRTPEGNFAFNAELRELPETHPLQKKKGVIGVVSSDKLPNDTDP